MIKNENFDMNRKALKKTNLKDMLHIFIKNKRNNDQRNNKTVFKDLRLVESLISKKLLFSFLTYPKKKLN